MAEEIQPGKSLQCPHPPLERPSARPHLESCLDPGYHAIGEVVVLPLRVQGHSLRARQTGKQLPIRTGVSVLRFRSGHHLSRGAQLGKGLIEITDRRRTNKNSAYV